MRDFSFQSVNVTDTRTNVHLIQQFLKRLVESVVVFAQTVNITQSVLNVRNVNLCIIKIQISQSVIQISVNVSFSPIFFR